MGRPRDQFAWAQVEELDNGTTWKCIHCNKVYSGAASRIRNHVSGQGNGIAACEKASEAVKNEALKKVAGTKRARGNSSALSTSTATEEETVIDAFVKFLMCNNSVPSLHSDYVVKDPSLRELMERLCQHGVELSLLRGDSSLALQHSVLRIKHEVDRNMLMLKESWKTTGCTLMAFDLNKEFDPYGSMEEKIVIAIYCLKGIIFVEAPADDHDYIKALTRHSPSLYTDEERVHWLRHYPYDHDNYKICELNHIGNWEPYDDYWNWIDHICLRSEIQNLCNRSYLDSEWARNLIDVTVRIHEHLCLLGDPWYYRTISTEIDFSLDVSVFKKEASRLPIFLLIIQHDPERESSPDHRMNQPDTEAITKGSEFWSDGRQLALILNCVLKVGDVMDTLVPTAGYFKMAFDKVKKTVLYYGLQLGDDALQFWEQLKSKIENFADCRGFTACSRRLASSCLNPVYFLQQNPQLPVNQLKTALKALTETQGEDPKDIDEEVGRYAQAFIDLSGSIRLEDHHPVRLWEDHGSDLPVLQRCALELLSRPLSCVCKQVKEHLYQLQGAEDYILRLNFRMMRHFQHLGDDIYKPLDLSRLDYENFKQYIVTNEPQSEQSEFGMNSLLL